jgi:hypothetical protein
VREELRGEWASYYAARREGLDAGALADMRTELIARQKEVLEERRDAAIADKRAERDFEYRALLDRQKEERGELIDRQELGLRSPELLDRAYPHLAEGPAIGASLQEALDRFGIRRGRDEHGEEEGIAARGRPAEQPSSQSDDSTVDPLFPHPPGNPQGPPSRDIGTGIAGGILGALGNLADSLMGGHAKPRSKQLARFGVQRGQPPPGDAGERAAREQRQAYEDWRDWKERHQLAEERER